MSNDPFADLLSSFKGEKQKSNTTSETVSLFDKHDSPSVSSPAPSKPLQTMNDDLDAAFDVFNSAATTPAKQGSPVVDEVKDMEIARLMSLDVSLERALQYYERGILYDDVLRRRHEKHEAKRQAAAAAAAAASRDFTKLFDNSSSNTLGSDGSDDKQQDLFSMATGLFNKGKSFMEERLKQRQQHQHQQDPAFRSFADHISSRLESPIRAKHERSPYTDEQVGGERRPEPAPVNEVEEPSVIEGDLLGDFDELSVSSPQHEALLDFEQAVSPPQLRSSSARPPISISAMELSGFGEFKSKGGELFAHGNYSSALLEYEKSLNTLPSGHPLRIISLSNIITTQLKLGESSSALQNIETALQLIGEDELQLTIPASNPPKSYREFWGKITMRKAEALEHVENYASALECYKALIDKGFVTSKVMDGKRRCQKIVSPPKPQSDIPPVARKKPSPNVLDSSSSTLPKRSDNLEKIQRINKEAEQLENKKFLLRDKVDEQIKSWSQGKENDLRQLLADLPKVLTWSNDWKPVTTSDLVMPKKVKITYLKAIAKTHPDKLNDSLEVEHKMLAEDIFSILSKAWEAFKEENNIN